VASVSPLPAVLQLADETVVDGVTTVGDVEEDVDLLHVLHEAPGDDRVGATGLGWSVDNSGVDICGGGGGGGGESQEVGHLGEEAEQEQHVDHYNSQQCMTSLSCPAGFNM